MARVNYYDSWRLAKKSESNKLFKHIEYYVKDVMSKLYLREMSAKEWKEQPRTMELIKSAVNLKTHGKFTIFNFL
jgi:hypothetical protein